MKTKTLKIFRGKTQEHVFEFHVSRKARDTYGFDDVLFTSTGHVIFANFRAARLFAHRMNAKRDLRAHPEQTVRAGQINAMGLIDEILHHVVALYRTTVAPGVFGDALVWLQAGLGEDEVGKTLLAFVKDFPPLAVYKGSVEP
ncbi:MAG: hypothetical protein D6743_14505, partial [Calditrichaeota bacterium]